MKDNDFVVEQGKRPTSEFAIVSLVLGIFSFIQLMGMEKSILAVVFGILALRRLGSGNSKKGKKLAIAGIILGVAAIILSIVAIVVFFPKMAEMQQQIGQ